MTKTRISALVAVSVGALLACAPVAPTSARDMTVELPAGLPLDAGTARRLPRLDPASAVATLGPPIELALGAPDLPSVRNHEPAMPPRPSTYECRLPNLPIRKARACRSSGGYPECRWQLPLPRVSRGLYSMWRNTTEDRWWGRPGLVGVVLAAAREFERLHPNQMLDIGDLDAAGPRHATHDRGVDVDMYLRGAMVTENEGAGLAPWNYWDRDPRLIEDLRWRVEELARILATCAEGKLRIYYNDPVVEQRFHAWFREQGYESPFGAPMQPHNDLHQFHFHVTVAVDVAAPPRLRSHPSEPVAVRDGLAAVSPPRGAPRARRGASSRRR